MPKDKLNLIKLAKFVNQEIFVEELLRSKTENLLKKYSKKKKLLKIKILITKIFYSVFFGILPVIPLMTYFEMTDAIITQGHPIQIAVFSGSLLFLFFFILQFFNVFLMGMIEVSLIMSNSLFYWLQTLPISTKKLQKLKLISVFRTFDLPLIVITFGFPIAMFIGTSNVVIFLICLGISILQSIATFSALMIFGERINRIIDMNVANSRKTTIIRLVNIFGFVIIFFGSLVFVQWAISAIDVFFSSPMVQESPDLLNLILATIPFQSLSYLIAFITITSQISIHFWIGILCGLGLFIIFTYWIFTKALSGLKRITFSDSDNLKKNKKSYLIQDHLQINIKIRKPIHSHFIKDLSITSRNLKVFLSAVTPIIISFVFTFTFNFTVLRGQSPLNSDFIYNWTVIIAFQPIICGMLIYNLLNLEESGDPIFLSLPIIPKNQAKAKLLYFIIIQTISVISPYLVYMFEPKFIDLIITVLVSLPFAWFVLISMFEMRIRFFGRAKYRFVFEPVNPENKMIKWACIYILEYILTIVILSLGIILNYWGILHFILIETLVMLICYCILLILFKIIFSPTRKPKKKKSPKLSIDKEKYHIISKNTFFIKNSWLAISLLLISNFLLVLSINFYILALLQLVYNVFYAITFWILLLPNIILIFIRARFIPKDSFTKFKLPSRIFISIISGIIGAIYVINFHMFCVNTFSIPQSTYISRLITINSINDLYSFLTILIFGIWHGILFHGIVLPILLSKYKRFISILLDVSIFFFYYFIYSIFSFIMYGNIIIPDMIFNLIYMLCINALLSYLYSIQNSIYSEIIIITITNLFGMLPLFYLGIPTYIFFPPYI